MKTRIIASLILAPLLVVLIIWAPILVDAIVIGLLAMVASYEMLYRTGLLRHVRLNIYSAIMAFGVSLWSYFDWNYGVILLAVLIFYMAVFGEMMIAHLELPIQNAFLCFLSGIVIPFMLTSLVRILCMEHGRILVCIPFIVAFMSDIGAYFIGVFFGKHKLCPRISPKKSVEGLIGGVVIGTLSMVAYGLVIDASLGVSMRLIPLIVCGVIGCLASAFGDLCMSVVKRQTGIKDYGNLIPGHGGVLDRLDSVIVAATLTEALLLILPMV